MHLFQCMQSFKIQKAAEREMSYTFLVSLRWIELYFLRFQKCKYFHVMRGRKAFALRI